MFSGYNHGSSSGIKYRSSHDHNKHDIDTNYSNPNNGLPPKIRGTTVGTSSNTPTKSNRSLTSAEASSCSSGSASETESPMGKNDVSKDQSLVSKKRSLADASGKLNYKKNSDQDRLIIDWLQRSSTVLNSEDSCYEDFEGLLTEGRAFVNVEQYTKEKVKSNKKAKKEHNVTFEYTASDKENVNVTQAQKEEDKKLAGNATAEEGKDLIDFFQTFKNRVDTVDSN